MCLSDEMSQPHARLFIFYPSYARFPTANLIVDVIPDQESVKTQAGAPKEPNTVNSLLTTGDARRYNEPDRQPLREATGVRALWNTNAREVLASQRNTPLDET